MSDSLKVCAELLVAIGQLKERLEAQDATIARLTADHATVTKERDEAKEEAATWEDHLDKHSDDASKCHVMIAEQVARATKAEAALAEAADMAEELVQRMDYLGTASDSKYANREQRKDEGKIAHFREVLRAARSTPAPDVSGKEEPKIL